VALLEANARVAVTGEFYFDKTAAGTAPTDGTTALNAAYKGLGYATEEGVTLTLPDAAEPTLIKAWQNGATVRTLRGTSDDVAQLTLSLVETKIDVIEAVFGSTVTSAVAEGNFEYDPNDTRTAGRAVLSIVDGAELMRFYFPQAIVSSVGEIVFVSTDTINWNVTFDLERNTTAGYAFKSWMTALKTP
jgi:hypothetical protein